MQGALHMRVTLLVGEFSVQLGLFLFPGIGWAQDACPGVVVEFRSQQTGKLESACFISSIKKWDECRNISNNSSGLAEHNGELGCVVFGNYKNSNDINAGKDYPSAKKKISPVVKQKSSPTVKKKEYDDHSVLTSCVVLRASTKTSHMCADNRNLYEYYTLFTVAPIDSCPRKVKLVYTSNVMLKPFKTYEILEKGRSTRVESCGVGITNYVGRKAD